MPEIEIRTQYPEGEDVRTVIARISQALRNEFGSNTRIDEQIDEETGDSEVEMQIGDWVRQETEKEKERARQKKEDTKAIKEFAERVRERVQKIRDSDLESLPQLYDEARKDAYKEYLATLQLCQEELEKEEASEYSERARLYSRGSY